MSPRARTRPLAPSVALVAAITCSALDEARADETAPEPRAQCDAAFEAGELRLRPSEGRLLEARDALLACALPSCQPWMVDDCTKRLAEVNARIPSVVFSAEDGRGAPVYDVRVLEDDRELLARLDGRAVEMNPGPHELVAERGHTRVKLSAIVIEGKKAQQIVFKLGGAIGAEAAPATGGATTAGGGREAPPRYPWARPLAGGMLAGGLVATGVGVGFLAAAIAKKNAANCDADNVCDGEPLESGRRSARAATVSFAVGGALAVGSAVTFLVFGRTRVQAAASLHHVQVVTTW